MTSDSKSFLPHFPNICKIVPLPSTFTAVTLIQAIFISHLDYSHSQLSGLLVTASDSLWTFLYPVSTQMFLNGHHGKLLNKILQMAIIWLLIKLKKIIIINSQPLHDFPLPLWPHSLPFYFRTRKISSFLKVCISNLWHYNNIIINMVF